MGPDRQAVIAAVDDEINMPFYRLQEVVGVRDGGYASMFWSGEDDRVCAMVADAFIAVGKPLEDRGGRWSGDYRYAPPRALRARDVRDPGTDDLNEAVAGYVEGEIRGAVVEFVQSLSERFGVDLPARQRATVEAALTGLFREYLLGEASHDCGEDEDAAPRGP